MGLLIQGIGEPCRQPRRGRNTRNPGQTAELHPGNDRKLRRRATQLRPARVRPRTRSTTQNVGNADRYRAWGIKTPQDRHRRNRKPDAAADVYGAATSLRYDTSDPAHIEFRTPARPFGILISGAFTLLGLLFVCLSSTSNQIPACAMRSPTACSGTASRRPSRTPAGRYVAADPRLAKPGIPRTISGPPPLPARHLGRPTTTTAHNCARR